MFKAWLGDEATARGFFYYAEQYGYTWSDGKKVLAGEWESFPGAIYVVVRGGSVTWGADRSEYLDNVAPTYIDAIRSLLSPAALYEQLTEECAELGKEALKAARIIRKENPTPDEYIDVMRRFLGEVNDIKNVLDVLSISADGDVAKLFRWVMRLEG